MLQMKDVKRKPSKVVYPTPSEVVSLTNIKVTKPAPKQVIQTPVEPAISLKDVARVRDMTRRVEARIRGEKRERVQKSLFYHVMKDGAWKGRRCFIIGGGPSIKNMDLSKLKGELTIGINRAYELLYPSILLGMDTRVIGLAELGTFGEESRKKYVGYEGNKVWVADCKLFPDNTYTIPIAPVTKPLRIGSVRALQYGNNSGYAALNLAAALGANPIYLLGFDMKGDGGGKQTWWHNGYPTVQSENVYVDMKKFFTAFAPVLKQAGIQVVNLTPDSALTCFEFGDYEEVLSKKEDTPLFIVVYPDTPECRETKRRLVESLYRYGCESISIDCLCQSKEAPDTLSVNVIVHVTPPTLMVSGGLCAVGCLMSESFVGVRTPYRPDALLGLGKRVSW